MPESDTLDDQDLDDDLEADGAESETDLVRRLRQQVKGQSKELKELRPLKDRVAEFEIDKSLSKAFDQDELTALTERQRAALVREVGDDKSPEALRKAAEEFRWVEAKTDPLAEELAGHERVESAGTGAASAAATKLDANAVADWPMDKMLRFKQQHPDAWDQIKKGEAVYGITF